MENLTEVIFWTIDMVFLIILALYIMDIVITIRYDV